MFWLNKSYENQIRLSGIVYLHPIHESMFQLGEPPLRLVFLNAFLNANGSVWGKYLTKLLERMTGASRKNMKIFKQLCGDSNLQSVVLATTMWKASTNETTRREFEERQETLRVNPKFWGEMASHGSPVLRHNDNVDSALSIVRIS